MPYHKVLSKAFPVAYQMLYGTYVRLLLLHLLRLLLRRARGSALHAPCRCRQR